MRRGLLAGAVWWFVLLWTASCVGAQQVDLVDRYRERTGDDSTAITVTGAERMNPVQHAYGEWGRQVYDCVDRMPYDTRRVSSVRVFTADYIEKEGQVGAGIWFWPRTLVVLEEYAASEGVIKHELAHIYCPNCPHPVVRACAER